MTKLHRIAMVVDKSKETARQKPSNQPVLDPLPCALMRKCPENHLSLSAISPIIRSMWRWMESKGKASWLRCKTKDRPCFLRLSRFFLWFFLDKTTFILTKKSFRTEKLKFSQLWFTNFHRAALINQWWKYLMKHAVYLLVPFCSLPLHKIEQLQSNNQHPVGRHNRGKRDGMQVWTFTLPTGWGFHTLQLMLQHLRKKSNNLFLMKKWTTKLDTTG